eukprot:TRINITY_DN9629_c0_g2_i1.p1 TRINITY_DN9629_c0_g2~~TRINITY_DN9629_c0_g2_i1.p1  ORF type:complete len:364 (+),score=179.04 TRINITY_DN9629_c0_g2_i1:75-1094(+)
MAAKKLYGQGNPLLDISAEVDADFLAKYELQPGNAILAEDKHQPLYAELAARPDVVYIPGGATLNSIRVANWVAGGKDGWATYCGCIADDQYGKTLKGKAEEEGLAMPMYYTTEAVTGTCGVCIVKQERSLVANLAAANKFEAKHLEDPQVWKAVEEAQVYYSAGFFLTVSLPAMMKVAEHAFGKKDATYCLNLAAPFIVQFFTEQLDAQLPLVDILFGNETEAKALSEKKGWGTDDVAQIAVKAQQLPKKGKNPRLVVFTQGSTSTVVADAEGTREFPVPKVDKIVDTNGAGDAFVGGFLAYYCQGKPIADCVQMGHAAAGHIIQQSGCQFAGAPPLV